MRFVKNSSHFRKWSYQGLFVFVLVLALSHLAFADRKNTDSNSTPPSGKDSDAPKPAIKNFGRIGDHFFRGSQPRPEDYATLAKLGVKTVVDLRDDPEKYAEECAAKAGLKYISLPLSDKNYPTEGSAEKFLAIVSDGANWPVFVHCAGGRHRTGAMTAVYRMSVEGWDVNRAYREMKDYDFYTRWGHKVMKDFVFDYSLKVKAKREAQIATEQSVPAEAAPPEKP
jgi:tyrosine-protein phosphatase SIW14